MTVVLHNGASAGLFDRLGSLFGGQLDLLALMGGAATARVLAGASWATRENTLYTNYSAAPTSPATIDGLDAGVASWRSANNAFLSGFLSGKASQTVQDMVNADVALRSKTLAVALQTLVSQMKSGAQSVQASVPAVGAQTAVGTPVGNPVLVFSVKRGDGLTLEYALPETLTFTTSRDSQGGGAAGNETLSVNGQAAADPFAYNWPAGSGINGVSLQLVDGSKYLGATGNLLNNSDFTTFTTANLPDNWTALVGAAGTDIFNGGSGNAYTPGGAGGSLQFTGTGAALLVSVAQPFAATPGTGAGTGGTSATLLPDTVYHLNGWLKCSATPTAGVAEFALVDGSNAVINDDQAVANSFTKSLTAVSTTYVNFNGAFRTPAVLPSTVKLRVRLSTAIDSGKSCYFARLALTQATQLYAPQGPFVAGFSGANKTYLNDTWTAAVTNTFGIMQREFLRNFKMPSIVAGGLILPSSGSPTILDSYVA